MNHEDLATKVTQILPRADGSEVKIVAQAMFGMGLHRSIDITVFKREDPGQAWKLCNDRPHPDWLSMPLERYLKEGRSEVLRTVSPGEILRVTSLIGRSMSQFEATV
jgi:hypothetical protein